jgi:hypothetical protein
MPLLRTEITLPAPLGDRMGKLIAAIADKMSLLTLQLQQHIVQTKLSGQVLHPRTGKLIESVQPEPVRVEGPVVMGAVMAGGDQAMYAATQEYGGTRPYEIVPVTKKALAFVWEGKQYIRQSVYRKPLPPRPYMAPSLEEMAAQITEGIREAVEEALL